ncbi:MAG: hypothetical protein OEV40_32000, partial [Acidimicrobiia bacterium]|nr:hypothetical protein [Acidimicrobiia bacterium]
MAGETVEPGSASELNGPLLRAENVRDVAQGCGLVDGVIGVVIVAFDVDVVDGGGVVDDDGGSVVVVLASD